MCGICNAAKSGTERTTGFSAAPLYTPRGGKDDVRRTIQSKNRKILASVLNNLEQQQIHDSKLRNSWMITMLLKAVIKYIYIF